MFVERRRYSFIENIFRILEYATIPRLKNHIATKMSIKGKDYNNYFHILLDKELLTYIGKKMKDNKEIRDKRFKNPKYYTEFLIITERGKKVLEHWNAIKELITFRLESDEL